MELYTTIASWAGWPAVVALFLVAIGFGLWMHKKEGEIWEREKALLESQLEAAKQKDPDILLDSLKERYDLAIKELEQARNEQNVSKKTLAEKIEEILRLKQEVADLKATQNQELQRVKSLDKTIGGTVMDIHEVISDPAFKVDLLDLSPEAQRLYEVTAYRFGKIITEKKEPPKP